MKSTQVGPLRGHQIMCCLQMVGLSSTLYISHLSDQYLKTNYILTKCRNYLPGSSKNILSSKRLKVRIQI